MRPVRKIDPADLWFGVVFGVIAVGVFALYAIVVWDTATTSSTFWPNLLAFAGLWVAVNVVRGPTGRLGRGPRFLSWFIFGTVSFALFAFSRGEPFNLALAAGMGLAWAVVDWLVEHFRSRREVERG
jgi:hypothetical protein